MFSSSQLLKGAMFRHLFLKFRPAFLRSFLEELVCLVYGYTRNRKTSITSITIASRVKEEV